MKLKIDPAHVKRYRQIATLLLRHGRGDLVRSTGMDSVLEGDTTVGDPEAAARLAEDLEAMGPTFVKLGQLMSSRVDLLNPPYVEALSRLQDDVAPFDFERSRRSSAASCRYGCPRSSPASTANLRCGVARPGPSGDAARWSRGRRQGAATRYPRAGA